MAELNKLELNEQLLLVEKICDISTEQLANPQEPLGKFRRGGVTYYRLRAGEYRIYFEVTEGNVHGHYLLHRNTLTDFLFRSKLPVSESQMVEQHQSFWRYLENLKE